MPGCLTRRRVTSGIVQTCPPRSSSSSQHGVGQRQPPSHARADQRAQRGPRPRCRLEARQRQIALRLVRLPARCSCVYEIERSGRERVGADVVPVYLDVLGVYLGQKHQMQVCSDHASGRADDFRQPSGDRPSRSADLQTPSTLADSKTLNAPLRKGVEPLLQQLETAPFVFGRMRERVVRCLTHNQNRKLRYSSPSATHLGASALAIGAGLTWMSSTGSGQPGTGEGAADGRRKRSGGRLRPAGGRAAPGRRLVPVGPVHHVAARCVNDG